MKEAFIIEEITDSEVEREINRVIDLAGRNRRWFGDHAHESNVFDRYRGRFIAISEGDFFVGSTPEEVERAAQDRHPDNIPFIHYIPKEKAYRVYANQRRMAQV